MLDTKVENKGYGDDFRPVNASLLSPREIYLTALKHEAVNLILLHNHPSGDPTPSRKISIQQKGKRSRI